MTEKLKNQKDSLARLMATENLTIVHKKIPTAYFDVKNRVLACPTFKDDISPELYDLFMGHEVGHALNTPYEGLHSTLTENRTLKGYLNVVEDVRIEKAIKQKYQGLRTSFFKAYNELMERNFFGIKGRNLQELSLIDKINLITKCGSRVNIKLNDTEQEFLDMAEACKTWEEVVECANSIYEYSKENEERDEEDEKLSTMQMPESEDGDEEDETESSPMSGEESDDEPESEEEEYKSTAEGDIEEEGDKVEETLKESGAKGGKFDGKYDELDGARESITEHYAHNNEDDFVDETANIKTNIDLRTRFKNADIDSMIYDTKQITSDWQDWFAGVDQDKLIEEDGRYYTEERKQETIKERSNTLVLGKHYRKHLQNKNKKIVAHMAKEFELRQNAHRSARAYTGTSGDLDMNRLAKYQIVDDIFKRVTYIPDGKNHGVNVLLDWSGSICNEAADMLEQSIILSEFCRKVNIPYRVYLFSDSIVRQDRYDYSSGKAKLVEIMSNEISNRKYSEMLDYLSCILVGYMHNELHDCWGGTPKGIKLIEEYNSVFSSIQEWESGSSYWGDSRFSRYCCPDNYRLGGTPLDECLVAMRKFLPEFNRQYGIEKSILTIITDGFSFRSEFFDETEEESADYKAQAGDDYYWSSQRERSFIDPYINKNFLYTTNSRYGRNDFEKTQNILEWLSETCNVTVTGYFVFTKKRDFQQMGEYIIPNFWEEVDGLWRDMRKSGVVVDTKGYNKLFLTTASNLATTGDDELGEEFIGANKNRVTAAFKRNQKGKSTSRFLTNEFIKEIA